MNVKTTGTINERLVQLALEGYMPKSWYKLTQKKYQWLGDFGIMSYPLSTIISVKSFKNFITSSSLVFRQNCQKSNTEIYFSDNQIAPVEVLPIFLPVEVVIKGEVIA